MREGFKIYFDHKFRDPIYVSVKGLIVTIVILGLFASNIYFVCKFLEVRKELRASEEKIESLRINKKVLNFTELFIKKVLKSEGEISVEDRLQLENAVRSINDKQILNQWNKLLESETEEEGQIEVKNLLEMLVNKISY